ncbi:hypothetical protein ABZ864_45070 [Streptomyces sp. NPDC047082]|uniref:hypothetical protein n=1 Tax=Streptomyces sp. NPDC047082 TaxID=3155259 RepID=UPI0033F77FA0
MKPPSKSDYLRLIQPVIQGGPAAILKAEGFAGGSLSFVRSIGDVNQEVEFGLFVRPKHARDSAQLVLNTHISPTGVTEIYREMLPSDPEPLDSCRISAPLESIARERVSVWLFKDEVSAASLEDNVLRAVSNSVLPYLEGASSADGLFAMCRDGVQKAASVLGYSAGNRATLGAALAVSIGKVSEALDLVRLAYSENPNLRAQYDSVFSFLEGLQKA